MESKRIGTFKEFLKEQRQKKINNAGAETIMKLARVLNCSASDLLELEC